MNFHLYFKLPENYNANQKTFYHFSAFFLRSLREIIAIKDSKNSRRDAENAEFF